MEQFKVGDGVQLKAGRCPLMLVEWVSDDRTTVRCIWWVESISDFKWKEFPAEALINSQV